MKILRHLLCLASASVFASFAPAHVSTGANAGEDQSDAAVPANTAMAPITDIPGLPRVLLIGDSISIGYTLQVRELLKSTGWPKTKWPNEEHEIWQKKSNTGHISRGWLVSCLDMRTLLRLDASSQTAQSHSRALADYYEARWKQHHPEGKVITRDLVREPIPHLDEPTIATFYAGGKTPEGVIPTGIALSTQLINELKAADDIVVSSAVYNFGMPSALKAWIDHIVRFGHTIAFGEKGPAGLLSGKHACFLTARGGNADRSPDFQYPVLQAVFTYIGIRQTTWISLEGTRVQDGGLESRIGKARAKIDDLFIGKTVD